VIAVLRVYEEPIGQTLAKVFALAVVTLIVDTVVNLAAIVLTVWLV
jgi:hypothetical protein